jgi:hypothetical protein
MQMRRLRENVWKKSSVFMVISFADSRNTIEMVEFRLCAFAASRETFRP